MKPYFEEDGITIYHGDCREVLPQLPSVEAMVTDPPYGVLLGERNAGQERLANRQPYAGFTDDEDYLREVVVPGFSLALSRVARAAMTPGNRNASLYPRPDDVGVWYNPAGTSRGKWGWILAHLIFYYGDDPRMGQQATASSVWGNNDSIDGIEHPCPKPLRFTKWLVGKASLEGETILDPFMGSGTTLRAAKDLGRKAIGIEIHEPYCEIAAKRLSQKGELYRLPPHDSKAL
jgi:site-specific DNA-methyltransferase (adenine-specific)